MAEVPQWVEKECKERFGDELYFVFNPHKERFVAKAKMLGEEGFTYDVFYVEDDLRRYREITMEDIYRCERAKVIDPASKLVAKQEMEAKLAKERRAALDKPKSKKSQIITDLGNELSKNPILARGFVADSKRKYSNLKQRTVGNKVIIDGGK